MSLTTLLPDPAVVGDLAQPAADLRNEAGTQRNAQVTQHLVSGASTLGFSILVERGTGFLANILAARFGGAAVFGAYSLGISTANNISTYAAGGIGATATRFSGKYNEEAGGYATFGRALAVVALVSAAVAAAALWAGALPIAHLLHKPQLAGLLRWAALSAAGMILVESARGFFVGQRRLAALALLSVMIGFGMVTLLPALSATRRPTAMIMAQGGVAMAAVAACLLLARPLKLIGAANARQIGVSFRAMLREVWTFGFIQLSGLLGANLAGWWLTALVARADTTLVQMGFFAIASQLRNLIGVVPGLLTESSYAVMAGAEQTENNLPDRVMAMCTYAATTISFALASVGAVLIPWLLHGLYGQKYADAGVAAAIGMGVAMVQMGNSAPSARMSIVSIRWIAAGNTGWAVIVAAVGTVVLLHKGSAAAAMAVFFLGHVLLASMVLMVLHRHNHLPLGMTALFALSTGGIAALGVIAAVRARYPQHALLLTGAMAIVMTVCGAGLYLLGKRHRWLVAVQHPVHLAANAFWSVVNGIRRKRRVA